MCNYTTKTQNKTNKNNKAQTRIKDWRFYNAGLLERGAFIELAKTAIREADKESRKRKRNVGRPRQYQDAIILVMAVYREIFQLTFREAEGFARDIFSTLGVKVPHYSTLERRMKTLKIDLHVDRRRLQGNVVLMVDSTGYKASGEGEWKVRKHGANKRRGWTKAHYLVDYDSLQIVSMSITPDNVGDNLEVPNLVEQLPDRVHMDQLLGDGAYGSRALYKYIETERGATLISPPHKGNKRFKKPFAGGKEAYVKRCEEIGRDEWKNEVGYHRRSLVETNMFRLKQTFSDKVRGKTEIIQTVELQIRAMLLNRWTNQWMPKYTKSPT